MKIRVISDATGVVGFHVLDKETPPIGMVRGSLMAGEGQRVHDIEVPDDFPIVPSPEDIHRKLLGLSRKAAA
jgi:hypothetical protein